jgi:hypothetical protein
MSAIRHAQLVEALLGLAKGQVVTFLGVLVRRRQHDLDVADEKGTMTLRPVWVIGPAHAESKPLMLLCAIDEIAKRAGLRPRAGLTAEAVDGTR